MSMTRSAVMLAATLAMVLGGSAVAQSSAPAAAAPPEGIPWILSGIQIDGELSDVPDGVVASLLLEAGLASGNAGCNNYSGPYVLRGESLTFGPMMSTRMMCAEAPMSVESAYLDDLARVESYSLDRKGLTLADARGDALLTFGEAEAPSPTGSWVVGAYRASSGDLVSTIPGSLLTADLGPDGTLEGSSGCNHYTASYTVDGSDITIGTVGSTKMACASPELQTQETEFLAALVASTKWSQDGTNLQLADASGLVGQDTTVQLTAAVEASYIGSWLVTGFDKGNGSLVAPVADSVLTATFGVDGLIEGSSGCNLFSGPYTVSGWAMTVGPLATTLMACSPELDDQEQLYLAALQTVTSWASDANGIVLKDSGGVTKVALAPAP